MKELKSSKMVIDYIETAVRLSNKYAQDMDNMKKKLADDLLTGKGFELKKANLENELLTTMENKKKAIVQQIESDRAGIKAIVDKSKTSLTPEDIEFLNFLGSMETVTAEDLTPYQLQYQDTPLALKRIGEIAKQKDLFLPELTNKYEEAEKLFSSLEKVTKDFSTTYNVTTTTNEVAISYKAMAGAFVDNINDKTKTVNELFGFQSMGNAVDSAARFIEEFDKENEPSFQDQLREIVSAYQQ